MPIYKNHQILDDIYEYLETRNELAKQFTIPVLILNAVFKNRTVVEVKTENSNKKYTSASKQVDSSNELLSLQQHHLYHKYKEKSILEAFYIFIIVVFYSFPYKKRTKIKISLYCLPFRLKIFFFKKGKQKY